MLIKFYSEESGDFVMLENTADQLLSMMGHGGSREGSVSGEALSSALASLTSAVMREKDKPVSEEESEEDDVSDKPEEVALATRADPLIAMLRRASEAEEGYVMWRPD